MMPGLVQLYDILLDFTNENEGTYQAIVGDPGWLPSHWTHSTSSHSAFETASVNLDKIPRHSQPDCGICLTVPCFGRVEFEAWVLVDIEWWGVVMTNRHDWI